MNLKLVNGGVQPDRLPQIKFIADIIKSLEYHGGSGHRVIGDADNGIPDESRVFYNLSPHAKHRIFLLPYICGFYKKCMQLIISSWREAVQGKKLEIKNL